MKWFTDILKDVFIMHYTCPYCGRRFVDKPKIKVCPSCGANRIAALSIENLVLFPIRNIVEFLKPLTKPMFELAIIIVITRIVIFVLFGR